MNGIIRSSFKLPSYCNITNIFRYNVKPKQSTLRLYSTLWNNSKSSQNKLPKTASLWNTCNCTINYYSTKSEEELSEFLEQEITSEQKLQKSKTIPSKIDDFEVKLKGSEVTLIKSLPKETIEISFNINHSVDADNEEPEEDFVEMKSKPSFEVDIKREDTTLSFTCSFLDDSVSNEDGEVAGDIFSIDEVTLYKGEWKDTNYVVSGGILDGCLYDLLMNFLDEKGVNNEFISKVSDLSTNYEHSSYISLLRDLKKFASS